MSLILHIDTSVETASACLAENGKKIAFAESNKTKDRSSWLHSGIQEMMKNNNFQFTDLQAVAVSIGPGSYTGLRIGLSAAKGFCMALDIPLIAINTLDMMAYAAIEEPADLLCPMIDARRQEVFTAVFDKQLNIVTEPQAMIPDETSFDALLKKNKILFFGNGSKKINWLRHSPNALLKDIVCTAIHLVSLSYERFNNKTFSNVAYTEPIYLKEFFTKPTRSFKEKS